MSSSINADESWDKTTAEVGLPRRRRYNMFVALASHEMQADLVPGHIERATVWARLAQAEATFLAGEK